MFVSKPRHIQSTLRALCTLMVGMLLASFAAFVVWRLFHELANYHAMQSWVETPARVTRAELLVHRGHKTTSYKTTADYEYDYAGQHYRSARVGVDSGSDDVGDFQQRVGHELKAHHVSGEPFRCFVNPAQPGEAILYRDIRWEMVAFYDFLALLCGGIGGNMFVVSLFGLREAWARAALARAHPGEPWLWRPDWAANKVESSDKVLLPAALATALYWNVTAVPLWLVLPPEIGRGNYWALLPTLLPAMGLFIAMRAIVLLLRRQKYGTCVFRLASTPGLIGGELAGTIETTRPVAANRLRLLLHCKKTITKPEGKRSQNIIRELWHSEEIVPEEAISTGGGGSRIAVQFAIPAYCRPTEDDGTEKTEWHLRATAAVPGVNFEAEFLVPVFKTDESEAFFAAAGHVQ